MAKTAGVRTQRVTICGFGLIGGSIAYDLKKAGGRRVEIVAFDRPSVLKELGKLKGLKVRAESNLAKAVAGADLVVLAAPHTVNESILARLAKMKGLTDCLIVDTGAVKTPIGELAGTQSFPGGTQFLGTHPMSGREKAGAANAMPGLFSGRIWFADEGVRLSELNALRWQWMVTATGATPALIGNGLHDDLMAELSHLPQLLSTVLAAQVQEDTIQLAGPGLGSMLRLAGSPYSVWSEIVDQNRENIVGALERYRDNLDTVIGLIRRKESLQDIFAAAARSYRCLS